MAEKIETEEKKEPIFQDLEAEQDSGLMTVESLCMNCNENVSCINV
jgi:hypothetical protein